MYHSIRLVQQHEVKCVPFPSFVIQRHMILVSLLLSVTYYFATASDIEQEIKVVKKGTTVYLQCKDYPSSRFSCKWEITVIDSECNSFNYIVHGATN
ncbi:hypothetical protein GCK32_009656 [Trichostrongylus colubriformis]|uniref:Uncharacterized protein n=1 Tax=Trichostrongylus colubriformis TaxID=6319 RepID=A0AAN8F6R2_TRICO